MVHHKHNPRIAYGLLLGMVFSVFATAFVGYVSAQPIEIDLHSPTEGHDAVKFPESVVVITTNPDKLASHAEAKGIDVIDEIATTANTTYLQLEGSVSDTEIKQLESQQDKIIVGDITPNRHYKVALTPNDTSYGDQWNLTKISAPSAWDTTTGNSNVTIAVLDTGVLFSQAWGSTGPFSHSDFPSDKQWTNSGELGSTTDEGAAPNCTSQSLPLDKSCNNLDDDSNGFRDDYQGWDFMGGWRGAGDTCPNYDDSSYYEDGDYPNYVAQDNDPSPYSCDDSSDTNQLNKDHYTGGCDYGEGACAISHGTSVASVASASSNNAAGIAGVDWGAKIMNLRVMDGYGYGSSLQIAAAIDYATDNGADVINMSLSLNGVSGCVVTDSSIESAMSRAKTAGVVVVAASGNDGQNGVCYPARSSNAIAVGSSTSTDSKSSFSTYGNELDVLAPGSAVPAANAPSLYQSGTYDSAVYGTSFSAPHVAGLVALMKAKWPADSPATTLAKLTQSTDRPSGMNGQSFTIQYGYGRINAAKALQTVIKPPAKPSSTLAKGKTLSKSKYLQAGASGKYRLTLQSDGNLVLRAGSKAIWQSRTGGKGVTRLAFQPDGNLVLYTSKSKPVWSSRTNGKPAYRLVLQSDGNLVLYTSKGKPLWSTRTNR